MKQKFTQDLQTIYDELQRRQAELNSYYKLLDNGHDEAAIVVDDLLARLGLDNSDDNKMAALTRIVNLREDALEQVLQKAGFSEDEIIDKKEQAYLFVSNIHIQRHESLNSWIEEHALLTTFYRVIIFGVHSVGIAMNRWQSKWTERIINGVNRELSKEFDGDDEKIFQKLQDESLLDLDSTGAVGDRCYSVLHRDRDGGYRSIAYARMFKKEVNATIDALRAFVDTLAELEDEVFGQKEQWLEYLRAIEKALAHTDPNNLIAYWAAVDRAWMQIKTPLQIGHPLEYYEDHYRKAVALEWDLRIINPRLQDGSQTRNNIKAFARELADSFDEDARKIIEKNLTQVDEAQLYIGQPMLYYAAELNGLFSAQVVPNDEQVSEELGKKIFAYADFVLESKKSKPMMKLGVEFMGEEFVKKQRALAEEEPKLWHELYDISTIGHEFGHILWIDSDTETQMNSTGQFKNIEEFKATSGGLMAFFSNEKEELKTHIIDDLVGRSVGLMAWQEVGEVLPYYCEGLIHLDILFGSGVITYDGQIHIDYSKYDTMREAYKNAYKILAQNYLEKVDASIYLGHYAVKTDGIYLPKDEKIKSFVEYYYARYKEIGQQTAKI